MNEPAAQPKPLPPGAEDPATLLKILDVEIALRRAKRLAGSSDSQRTTARLLGLLVIVFIFLAAMGAVFYLKTTRYANVTHPPAAPAPGASGRPVH